MHLLAQEEYGLRCLLQVAKHQGSRPITIPDIALAEGLSPEYTAKLMRTLRRGELVSSTRGAGGGYRLARPSGEITAWQVIQVLGNSFFPEGFCESHPGQQRSCVHTADCSVRALWSKLETTVRTLLESITVESLQRGEQSMVTWLETPRRDAGIPMKSAEG